MGRDLDPKCKRCRRAGEKLYLKGERCNTPKCAFTRRPYAPGIQSKGGRRRSLSEYGRQLAEKQKLKRTYGLLEKQFKNYVNKGIRQKGDSRENLMAELEKRLDNVIYRLGFASSREAARQMVSHGLVKVNERKVTIPSFQVKTKDKVAIKESAQKSSLFANLKTTLKKYKAPSWLKLDVGKMEGLVLNMPSKEDLGELGNLGMIIEFYSR